MPSGSVKELDDLLVSKEFMEDPYPILHRLREEDPVHWSDSISGWNLTRYDDMVIMFKDVSHYSNERRLGRRGRLYILLTERPGKLSCAR
jgi:hypothetical protein